MKHAIKLAMVRGAMATGLSLGAGLPITAHAADEEIQVYIDDMGAPGTFGLDGHNNYVFTGRGTRLDDPLAQDSLHRFRVMPEFSYGISDHLEAGLYLPLGTVDRDGHVSVNGVKGRLKYTTHPADNPDLWYGVNFELGRVGRAYDVNPWNAELKAMLGTRRGRWLLAGNINVDFVVSGPQPSPATVEFASKIGYAIMPKVSLAVEGYNGIGTFRQPFHMGQSDQTVMGVVDVQMGDRDLNLGAGEGFGSNPDHFIVKAILGVPIDRLIHPHHS